MLKTKKLKKNAKKRRIARRELTEMKRTKLMELTMMNPKRKSARKSMMGTNQRK